MGYQRFFLSPIAVLSLLTVYSFTQFQNVLADTVSVCATGCDYTTIQSAIDDPSLSSGDVINIRDPVHTEEGIIVAKDITIQGQGAERTIVQAHVRPERTKKRVFFIAKDANVIIRDMTIRHGNPTFEPESGGGIRNEGTLLLENVIVRDNSGSAGGGILNDGTLTLINCTVSNNKARGGGSHYFECSTGGGIKNMAGVSTLINSTVRDNHAEGKGGGIHVACNGTLVLVNSTINGNSTLRNGGGIYVNGVGEFTHATISRNNAKSGGGIYLEGTGEKDLIRGHLSFTNTLVADNVATFTKYGIADCAIGDHAIIGENQNNLIEDGSCDPAYSGDPMLGNFTNDYSSGISSASTPSEESGAQYQTQTQALFPESQAIDAIPASECVVGTDQLGTSRPQGTCCDIGAFELPQEGSSIAERVLPIALLAGSLVAALLIGGLAIARKRL